MTTNQTIDGVPRELLERLLTDACNENWSDLNELLHSPTACRCKRYGKGNPHWPCPVHASPAAQHQVEPTEEMKEAGCQAYMDADGMIGIMHRSSMGHAYQAMRALEQPAPVAVPRLEMAHVVRAHMEIPGCPVLTSNQCHALAMKLNESLNPSL